MSGDPKKYRRNAARCVALANGTKDENLKSKLMKIATTWSKLAEKHEYVQSVENVDGSTQNAERHGAKS